jgi:acetyl esterase/lipase
VLDPEIERRFGWTRAYPVEALWKDPALADRVRLSYESGADPRPPAAVASELIDGPRGAGTVPVRVYHAARPERRPVAALVWAHGGAFAAGDLDMLEADGVARALVDRAGLVVVSVDYALVDGRVRYPVPHQELIAAIRWTRANADRFGIDAGRVAIGGASAGGALAWSATAELGDRAPLERPVKLVLAYPAVLRTPSPERAMDPSGVLPDLLRIPPAALKRMFDAYAPEGGAYASADVADLAGLPPSLVLAAGLDDLRGGAERFADRVRESGGSVEMDVVDGAVHGFLNLPSALPATAQALDRIAAFVTAA